MVFEKIRAENLSIAVEKLNEYLKQWDPKLYETEVNEFRRSKRTNGWTIVLTRDGKLNV
jgi:hypothetical protein